MFHFSIAMGLVHFLTCVMRRVEGWYRRVNFYMGEDSSYSQTIKEGNESILFKDCLYHRPRTDTMPIAEGREVQLSLELSLPAHN